MKSSTSLEASDLTSQDGRSGLAKRNLQVEFFHDVICSFCFPMSYRMRQLADLMPTVDVIHRSYALVSEPSDLSRMFGSRERAKSEVLTHWRAANANDDLHRFNIAGMQQAGFPFPTSMSGLLAAKAAWFVGGEAAYWDAFDALQAALFMHSRNVEDDDVILDAIKSTSIDVAAWKASYDSEATAAAVQSDLAKAARYGLRGVPALVVNGEHIISGAQPLAALQQALASIEAQMPEDDDVTGVCTPDGCF